MNMSEETEAQLIFLLWFAGSLFTIGVAGIR